MKPLKAFLFTAKDGDEWAVASFRDLEPLQEAVAISLAEPSGCVAIHVGFWRPETQAVAQVAKEHPGRVIVSEAAAKAFPPAFGISCSSAPIGRAETLLFHLALSGFGYRLDDDATPAAVLVVDTKLPVSPPTAGRSGWVAQMVMELSELAEPLEASGIWDEESYLAREGGLPSDVRVRVGLYRFSALTGRSPSESNILDSLHACPPWLLGLSLHQLGMTKRQTNVMKANSLETIAHVAQLGHNGLFRLSGLGRGSIFGLSQLIYRAFVDQTGIRRSGFGEASAALAKAPADADTPERGEVDEPNAAGEPLPTFVSEFLRVAGRLEEQQRSIWFQRLGYGSEPLTLQAIAEKAGVTRERIRQIEMAAYKKVRHDWIWEELADRLNAVLQGRSTSLLVAGLSAIDPWFEGLASFQQPIKQLLENLLDQRFNVFPIGGASVVSALTYREWCAAIAHGKQLLKGSVTDSVEKAHARFLIDGLLVSKGEELRDDLWEECSKGAIWAGGSEGKAVLSGFAESAEELVRAILNASPRAMRLTEIHEQATALGYDDHGIGYLRNASSNVALLYGRSTFGLIKHCPLNADQMDLVRAEAEDVIDGGEQGRQWHCSELYEDLLDRGLSFDGLLTKYIINIALKDSSELADLRRMVWGQKENWSQGRSSRLDVRQAVIALLEAEGRPMSTAAIRERLLSNRGVNNTFQIHPAPPLFRIGSGMWGLLGRDVDAASDDIRHVVEDLTSRLEVLQKGLHLSELPSELRRPNLSDERAIHGLLAHARSAGIRVDRGQYIYLEKWKSSRRVSVPNAVSTALEERVDEGISHADLWVRVCELTQRDVPRATVSQVLQGLDAEWDVQSGLWRPAASYKDAEAQDG